MDYVDEKSTMDSSSLTSGVWWTGIILCASLICFSKFLFLLKIFAQTWQTNPPKFGTCFVFIWVMTFNLSLDEYFEPEQAKHMNKFTSRDILVSISKSHLLTPSISSESWIGERFTPRGETATGLLDNPGDEDEKGDLGITELIWISSLINTLPLGLELTPKERGKHIFYFFIASFKGILKMDNVYI